MTARLRVCAIALWISLSTPAFSQNTGQIAVGSYRIEGQCSSTFYLGADALPQCASYIGIRVEIADRPMFIFPLKAGGQGWFFIASRSASLGGDGAIYVVEKLYDQALNAEFSYPAGECEIKPGPTVRCTVWKDAERRVLARELVFSGSGNWMRGTLNP